MIDAYVPGNVPLPDVPFHIGIGNSSGTLHAVEHRYATSPRREVPSVCGTSTVVAREWGGFARTNPHLRSRELCPHCAWAVALAQDVAGVAPVRGDSPVLFAVAPLDAELAALTAAGAELAALGRVMPDPLILRRVCEQILVARKAERDFEADHPRWADLLGHVSAHRPVLLMHEACTEEACDHDDCPDDCYGETPTVACRACSLWAGGWAGEWEGQLDVLVPAPCAVLPAVAAHYNLMEASA